MIISPFSKLQTISKMIADLSCQYNFDLSSQLKEVEKIIKEKTIQIMFFGSYNAGKSTMINSLLAEDRARVNDIPTTDKIDTYKWNGFNLLDSPGVNAPIPHESISMEALKRSNLIVLVVRGGEQDTKDIYDRLFTFIREGKEVLIILNFSNPQDVVVQQNKINEILEIKREELNLPLTSIQKIKVIPINGKTALKARIEGKDNLLYHSRYPDFEIAFQNWAKSYDNERSLLNSIKKQITNTMILPFISVLKGLSELDRNLEILRKHIDELNNQQSSIIFEVNSRIDYEFNQNKEGFISALSSDNPESAVTSILENIYNNIESFLT